MIGMKVEDNLDGATNFIFWMSIVIMLEENDLLNLVNQKVPKPNVEEDKSHWKKSDARARRILAIVLAQPDLLSSRLDKAY